MQDTETANKVKRKRSSPMKSHHSAAGNAHLLEGEQHASDSGSNSNFPATPNPRVRKQTKHSAQTPTRARSPANAIFSGSPSKSKSKRATIVAQALDASPTRKRPGTRTSSLVPMSPHAFNPNADYVPPSMLSVATAEHGSASTSYRRRGSTPIPPYEPPAERFTPPREIQLPAAPSTASPSKSKRRTTHTKPHSKEKGPIRASTPLPIKLEPPEIDLTVPPPPPSPSDDPILLIGTSRPFPSTPKKRGSSSGPTTKHTPSSLFSEIDADIDMDIPQPSFAPSSSFFSDEIPPVFDFENMDGNNGGAWSDSDDDQPGPGEPGVVEGEGEFTGRFYQYRSPVKVHDPPSSATRVRIDQWGKPISPHPKLLIADGSISADAIEEQDEVEDSPSAPKSRKVSPVPEFEEGSSGWVDESAAGPSGSRLPMTLSEIEEMKFGETSMAQDGGGEQDITVEDEGNNPPFVGVENSGEISQQSISPDDSNDVGMEDVEVMTETNGGHDESSPTAVETTDIDSSQDENHSRRRSRSPVIESDTAPPRSVNC